MEQKEKKFTVIIEDVRTGDIEEKEFRNFDKACALVEMIQLYNSEQKKVKMLDQNNEIVEI